MQIAIGGLDEKIVLGLCKKWAYPETIKVRGTRPEPRPDPDPEAEEGATIEVDVPFTDVVPNPQTKVEFVKEHVIGFIKNEYRLVVRQNKKANSDKVADEEVERDVNLN